MKAFKMFFLAGLSVLFTSASTFAVPLDITFTGGAPIHEWGFSAFLDPGFQDVIPVVNKAQTSSINLAGVNSISMTWAAPAGDMYVVHPPPPGLGFSQIYFEAEYGSLGPGPVSSPGSITSSSFSIQTVYGTSPLSGEALAGPGAPAVLYFAALASPSSSSPPFAFTSMTISADFSGTGASETLERLPGLVQGEYFADYTGDFALIGPGGPGPGLNYDVLPDPGPLITLEPLPVRNGSVPDATSTLTLAGLGFAGFLLSGRKQLPIADTMKDGPTT